MHRDFERVSVMKAWIRKIYNKYLPDYFVEKYRKNAIDSNTIDRITNHEIAREEWLFIKNKGRVVPVPYEWIDEYSSRDYVVRKNKKGYYSLYNDKILFWPDGLGKTCDAMEVMKELCIEQDPRSPHCYFGQFDLTGAILFDIGGAEGLITLKNIDKIKKAYIFECDEKWNNVLHKTFDKYQEKVEIIEKYVADYCDDKNITLDVFFESHNEDSIVVKMDIEGMELPVLKSSINSWKDRNNIVFSICTYHGSEDAKEIKTLFEQNGYTTNFTEGYMCFGNPPEFRKGVINAYKSQI